MKKLYGIAILGLFATTLAHGDIVATSNLGEPVNGETDFSDSLWKATSFTTGGTTSDRFELSFLGFQEGAVGGTATEIDIGLYTSVGGEPGIAKAGNVTARGNINEYMEVAMPGNFEMAGATEYFVVFKTSGVPIAGVATTGSTDESSALGGWSIGNTHLHYDGTTWTDFGSDPIKISVGVIPEPATLSLIALVGGGILLTRRIFMV